MIGLVEMAACLAESRKKKRNRRYPHGLHRMDGTISMARRQYAERCPGAVPCSAEYYRIIDRIARGENP